MIDTDGRGSCETATTTDGFTPREPEPGARTRWMGLMAKAHAKRLNALWRALEGAPGWRHIRPPEVGMVMVRGRIGGDGARFNLGEVTVTRCTVSIDDGGPAGHAYVMGRDKKHAERAAVLDALLQRPAWHDRIDAAVLVPLQRAAAETRAANARKAGATRVDFTTVARGED